MKQYFSTSAYPYMNGPMHLGHLYTMLKYYFRAHQRAMLTGQKVFLPYAFHCTGMPIYANAMKLAIEGETSSKVRKILQESDVSDEVIEQFKNPDKWIEYFPEEAARVLSKLELQGWSPDTHFITTKRNPYYNKFVEWQMLTLKQAGVIYFADRPAIYSKRDGQPCAAHDRQTGEEAKPVEMRLVLTNGVWFVYGSDDARVMTTSKDAEWGPYRDLEIDGQTGKITGYLYENYQLQKATGHTIYLPSERCVSRSGQDCCVAVTGQWYLNYSEAEWKRRVMGYIRDELVVHDPDAKKELLASAEKQYDWCISREIGLGTDIPWDTKFKVDSLSDSTAYWAYYTVVERLQGDMFGDNPGPSGLKPEQLTVPFWDYIFWRNDTRPDGFKEKEMEQVEEMRRLFRQRMPMDVRVSGKDLIHNHLIMAIYNGVILGGNFLPREILVGGHLKLNGQKMSKSTGNFITAKEALEKYPRPGLMLALAEAGDGMNDANLRLKSITDTDKAFIKTIRTTWLEESLGDGDGDGEGVGVSVYDKLYYIHVIRDCARWLVSAYERGRFSEGLEHGWRRAFKQYEDSNAGAWDKDLLARHVIKYALHPIFPELNLGSPVTNEIVHKLSEQKVDQDIISLSYLRRNLQAAWKKCKNKEEVQHVSIHEKVLDKGEDVMRHIRGFLTDLKSEQGQEEFEIVPDTKAIHEKCDPFKVKPIFY